MANRIDSLLAGLGSPSAVLLAWKQQFPDGSVNRVTLQELLNALAALRGQEETKRAAIALIASLMNQSLQETGSLYRANPEGNLRSDYKSTGEERDIAASLIAGE